MSGSSNHVPLTAKTLAGLEQVLAAELATLGWTDLTTGIRVVHGLGDPEALYRANLWARTAISLLYPITSFRAESPEQLYDGAKAVNWPAIFSLKKTFAIRSSVRSVNFRHSQFASLKVKDAIADRFRDELGSRPNVDPKNPHIQIDLHIDREQVHISLDSSGESLFKRGYRTETGPAPLNEVLAAGMVLLAGYDGTVPFLDPMCGSGTLPIEAALISAGLPPGYHRQRYAFMGWNNFDRELWQRLRDEVPVPSEFPRVSITGGDKNVFVINKARKNLAALPLERYVRWVVGDFRQLDAPEGKGIIVINPPYDERLEQERVTDFYRSIGDKLKRDFPGWTAWILSGHKQALKQIGLAAHTKLDLFNGGIECSFREYRIN